MPQRKEVLEQALSLPPEDRAYVVAALEESLSGIAAGELAAAQLLAELRRRSAAFRAGTASAKSAPEVLADQKQRQANETKA